jgi:adenosylmethionine-8-amino-7-oxononanoate aminotransferase
MTTVVRYPQGSVLLRALGRDLPVISHGEGIYLFDRDGKCYVDASAGALVASVGHGNREVADAVHAQLLRVGYVNGTQFTSEATEALAARLAALVASELPRFGPARSAFLCSGSEAIEAAVKFARQLWMERGEPARAKLVARVPSYHGNTLYALSASGRPHYRTLYGPLLSAVLATPAPYPYRCGLDDYAKGGAEHYAGQLEALIEREGPGTIAAFIVEPIIGSSAGAAVPPPGYFERVRSLCDRHGILIIADEVLCGTGRCGAFFASHLTSLDPDLIVLGKGLGGGYAPLSALLVKQPHLDEMRRGSGYFQHAQTYLQAPFMTAAGLAVLDYFERHDLVRRSARIGARLLDRLSAQLLLLDHVGCVQGLGLLCGVEMVADKSTRAPFPRERKVAERLTAHFFERGLIVWPNVGQADGTSGDLFMIGPPLVIDEGQGDDLVDSLAQAIKEFEP